MASKTKITVVGSGYVGMSLSVLLSQHNDVTILDIDQDRIDKINNRQSTVSDKEIQESQATIEYWKTIEEALKEIMDTIKWRHQSIKNMIEWRKFTSGV